jgi:aminomethyltransferase
MSLKRTPLFDAHVAAGAKMVDFGGFEMPLKYTGETAEHMAVRTGVGVFDVSHMGEAVITGKGALAAMQRLLTNDAAKIKDGQAMYAGLLNEKGGFVDDVVAYRFSAERFLVCLNAGNQDKDFTWMRAVIAASALDCVVENVGAQWSQLAVQGPKAVDVVATLCGESVRSIEGYHFVEGSIGGAAGIIARTGYTGEDGFELYVKNDQARAVWDAVVAAGAVPCGLACRDTLRLEAGMCLYGNDIDDDVTPLQANLGWIVKLENRPPFIGMEALQKQKAAGLTKVLRGLVMVERGIARHGYDVVDDHGSKIGIVTSGTQAPFVNKPIAFAYVDKAHAEPGASVFVSIRDKPVKATVTKLPFYKRTK